MRMSRRALVARAVAVLEEAMSQTRVAPVRAGPGLRLALAYLYAVSSESELHGQSPRQSFEDFLAAVTNDRASDVPEKDGRGRATDALPPFNHICRRAGYGR